MALSVTDPVSQAFDRTGRMLFKPFDLTKWFILGFSAWLAQLGEGGGGGNFNFPGGGGGGRGGGGGGPSAQEIFDKVWAFFLDNAWWIVPAFLVLVAIGIAMMWVRARGKFMFLDGVARDYADVVEPWKRLAAPANSFFRFDLALTLLMLAWLAAVGALTYMIARPDIQAWRFDRAAITAIVVGGILLLAGTLLFALTKALAEDFLIPLMYLRNGTIGLAWREFREVLLPGHLGSFVLFYLMKIVLGIAIAFIVFFATCLTCCLAALPYLGTVILLPVFIFLRSYSLYFLRQFGPQYNLLVERMPPPTGAFPVVMPPHPGAYPGAPPPMNPHMPPMPPPSWPPPPTNWPPPPPRA